MIGVSKILYYSEWSATVQENLMKGCLESAVRYNSISRKEFKFSDSVKNIIHFDRRPPKL